MRSLKTTAVALAVLVTTCSKAPERPAHVPTKAAGSATGSVPRAPARPAASAPAPRPRNIETSHHCPFGYPKVMPELGPTVRIKRSGYSLLHSSKWKIPIWVCEKVLKAQLMGNEPRKDRFKPDPQLAGKPRAELKDYKGSGYDRGHMAPAGDYTVSKDRKAESFYLSNMAPQKPGLNRQVWRLLEEKVRGWIKARGSGHVITGPVFYDPRVGRTPTIGPGDVVVPTHFYKIVVAKDSTGKWQAIAFVLKNRKYAKPYQWATYVKAIDWIEKHTGLDFIPGLSAPEEERLERMASRMW